MVLERMRPGFRRLDYLSPKRFAREARDLAPSTWLYVAHASELTKPGSYVAIEPWRERILVLRGRDLVLRAFVDRCPHRAVPITRDHEGVLPAQGLVCPYHGMAFSDDGLRRKAIAVLPSLSLEPRYVTEYAGHVFVAFGHAPPPFASYVQGAPPWLLEASYASLERVHRTRYTTEANWKLLVENFQESWHFPAVHPSLHARTPHGVTTSTKLGPNWFGGTMRFEEGTHTVSPSRTLADRAHVAGKGWRKHVYDGFFYPLWLTSLQPDYFLSYRLTPRSPFETEVQADIWGHASSVSGKKRGNWDEVVAFWNEVNLEDRTIVERQMRGVRSPSFRRMNLCTREEAGLLAFRARYTRSMP